MMPRRLIWLADGTWQKADQRHPTNVAKIARFATIDERQLLHYDAGVGTGWPRVSGGLFGSGIVSNILQGYAWLREHYRPGDWIILVGFSRGASTVRELAGMLGAVGFDNPDLDPRLVWKRYRAMYRTDSPVPVQAVAVFDTVGARGVPAGDGRWCLAPQFDDCNLGSHVKYGFHALALHEERKAFIPTLWTNDTAHLGVQQLWFKGWHSDIGGGTPVSGLSDIPLRWMLSNLITFANVTLCDGWMRQTAADPNAPMHPPGWFTRLYGMAPRRIPVGANIHRTAQVRPT